MSLQSRIAAVKAQGQQPLALLDIDLTLLENEPRTREILRRFVASLPPDLIDEAKRQEVLSRIEHLDLVYSIKRNLASVLNLDNPSALQPFVTHGLSLWQKLFFGDDLLMLDIPLEGALEAVSRLVDLGVHIIYVTARPSSSAPATQAALAQLGFPTEAPSALLLTKEDPRQSDKDFKVMALEACKAKGEVVLTAENEPAHINAFAEAFPKAVHVLVDTRHSEGAPEPLAEVLVLPRLLDVFELPLAPLPEA